jgi:hypothetical protein
MVSLRDRYRGALLGLAAGDALGTTLEFERPGTFAPLTDLVGGGPFGLQPGQWTDDPSMALCLAESLVECQGFDPCDQMERYLQWYRHGYLSSTGTCFDIGVTTRTALKRFDATGEPFAGSSTWWNRWKPRSGRLPGPLRLRRGRWRRPTSATTPTRPARYTVSWPGLTTGPRPSQEAGATSLPCVRPSNGWQTGCGWALRLAYTHSQDG